MNFFDLLFRFLICWGGSDYESLSSRSFWTSSSFGFKGVWGFNPSKVQIVAFGAGVFLDVDVGIGNGVRVSDGQVEGVSVNSDAVVNDDAGTADSDRGVVTWA